MGMLTRAAREEDGIKESDLIEEQYMKLFPKIGRDFVHREDLIDILEQVKRLIDPLGIVPINFNADSEARGRAKEYEAFLEEGKNGCDIYKDLIDLSEDSE